MPFRAMRNGFFVKSPANQELFVMTPALLLLVILSDQALGRDLSLVFSLLAVADWALNGYGLRGHAETRLGGSQSVRSGNRLAALLREKTT